MVNRLLGLVTTIALMLPAGVGVAREISSTRLMRAEHRSGARMLAREDE
jgi:hypothetical protein